MLKGKLHKKQERIYYNTILRDTKNSNEWRDILFLN